MNNKIIKQVIVALFLAMVIMQHQNAKAAEWEIMLSGTTKPLTSVWGASPADVFAAGDATLALSYNGTTWLPIIFPVDVVFSMWGTSNTNIYVVGFDGIVHYDGLSWSASGGSVMIGIWGSSDNDIFAVGSSGAIYHYNGSGWTSMTSGTSVQLNSVWCSSSNDAFAVGNAGTILHYNGSDWTSMTSGTTNTLISVWGNSGSDVFAVGGAGTILHYNGSTWSAISSGTTNSLNSVWGISGTDVFIVGHKGTIIHYNGVSCSVMQSGTTNSLYDVWGFTDRDVFAVGINGTILHYTVGPSTTTSTPLSTTTTAPSTLVELSSFSAEPSNKEIIIKWSTESETDNIGFNIYRSASGDENYIKVNASLIPAQGSTTQGAFYEFVDKDVKNRKTYYYKLEDIDLNGKATMHEPVSAMPRRIYNFWK